MIRHGCPPPHGLPHCPATAPSPPARSAPHRWSTGIPVDLLKNCVNHQTQPACGSAPHVEASMQIVAQYADQHADRAMQIDLHFICMLPPCRWGGRGMGMGREAPKPRKSNASLPPWLPPYDFGEGGRPCGWHADRGEFFGDVHGRGCGGFRLRMRVGNLPPATCHLPHGHAATRPPPARCHSIPGARVHADGEGGDDKSGRLPLSSPLIREAGREANREGAASVLAAPDMRQDAAPCAYLLRRCTETG